jgi:hypothetical protein
MSKLFLWLILLIVVAAFFPFLAIWSLNTLFGLSIPFTLDTWAATILLSMFLRGDGVKFNK